MNNKTFISTICCPLLLIMLGGCDAPEPQRCIKSEATNFKLTPAPKSETPLERWRRTKADWERASEISRKASEEIDHVTTMVAIGPYSEAEKDLKNMECTKVCIPEKTQ